MKLAVYPFASTAKVQDNLVKMKRAVGLAATAGVRLLVFHECALSGYPPIECQIEQIDQEEVTVALKELANLAKQAQMHLVVGTVFMEQGKRYNSMIVINDGGELVGRYDKHALWGWDVDNFSRGTGQGAFTIDTILVGFRICFDVRFPESFRQLYEQRVPLCFVSLSDTGEKEDLGRYDIIKSHLVTRAVENVMTVVSVNSLSYHQTAPTAIFNQNGRTIIEAKPNTEELLVYDYTVPEVTFGMEGRIVNNKYFMEEK